MKKQTKAVQNLLSLLILALLGHFSSAFAEDTEAFFNVTPSAPNVLFLLSNAESMSWDIDGQAPGHPQHKGETRMEILQGAIRSVFNEAIPDKFSPGPVNINVGLMSYGESFDEIDCVPKNKKDKSCDTIQYVNKNYRDYGIHGITLPITPFEDLASTTLASTAAIDNLPDPKSDDTIGTFIPKIADTWVGKGTAPIVDALYEAALYFRGEKMHWGQDVPASIIASHPTSHSGSPITQNRRTDGIDTTRARTYKSPITSHCQSNYIVMMSDGIPTYFDSTVQGGLGRIPGPASEFFGSSYYGDLAAGVGRITPQSGDGVRGGTNPKGFAAGNGGYELVRYISTNDNAPSIDGDQTIQTFMVTFGPLNSNERQYLESLASIDIKGTPEVEGYYYTESRDELAKAFEDIVGIISEQSISYASPGYSVNVKSGLEHDREVYIPMFDRRSAAVWPGNLKKFKINDVSGKRVIQDKYGVNAVDELGAMTDTAIDLWSNSPVSDPDGKDVKRGGLANLLVPADRILVSDLNCAGPCDLTSPKNLITEKNAENSGLIDNDILGLDSSNTATERKELIRFIRGLNADGSPRYHLGDMIHSEPFVVTYKDDDSGKEQYIFVATNEGYLHAFDTTTGEEKFAFMPKELLKNIKPQFSGLSARDHFYGIDGGITFWDDKSSNKKYLYFGMRRGGTGYYALDVTSINSPKFLWSKSKADSDYENIGQTWSIPYLARVGVKGKTCVTGVENCREVLIVSGGYDPIEDRDLPGTLKLDDATKSVATTMGNDIFIIDALNGDRIWSLQSDSSITNRDELFSSVPGGHRMLDTNYNKLVDRLYFADTGGYVWRLDLSENIGDSSAPSKLTKFADLGDVNTADSRKFYNEPDVAVMKINGKSVFVVSIGSGFRPHPLDSTLNDNFYILLDKSPYGDPDTTPILEGTLAAIEISGDVGATSVSQPDGTITDTTKNFKGWKVILPESGEKSLSTALGFDGVITFTTLIPDELRNNPDIDECNPPATYGRFYAINVLTGEAGLDLNEDGTINDSDVTTLVASGDIPGTPQSVFNPLVILDAVDENGQATGAKVCRHPVDIRIGKKLSQATGYDACRLEPAYWSDPVNH